MDVFTVLPNDRERGKKSILTALDDRILSLEIEDRPASQSPEPYVNGVDHEVTPQENIYKSIKRGKVGAIASKAGVDDGNRRAAKAAMG